MRLLSHHSKGDSDRKLEELGTITNHSGQRLNRIIGSLLGWDDGRTVVVSTCFFILLPPRPHVIPRSHPLPTPYTDLTSTLRGRSAVGLVTSCPQSMCGDPRPADCRLSVIRRGRAISDAVDRLTRRFVTSIGAWMELGEVS